MRDPVRANLLIREFVEPMARRAAAAASLDPGAQPAQAGAVRLLADRARARPPRPRDRRRAAGAHPDLEIDWLTQDPVTRVLAEHGERVHPASRWLASESGHFESEAGEHDLHAFQALRRMDEIMVANFTSSTTW